MRRTDRSPHHTGVLLGVLLGAACAASAAGETRNMEPTVPLREGSRVQIVVPTDLARPGDLRAARDLAGYFEKALHGCSATVVNDCASSSRADLRILLAEGNVSGASHRPSAGTGGFAVSPIREGDAGPALVITAADSISRQYGLYHIARKLLGVRRVYYDSVFVPEHKTLSIPLRREEVVPRFPYRGTYFNYGWWCEPYRWSINRDAKSWKRYIDFMIWEGHNVFSPNMPPEHMIRWGKWMPFKLDFCPEVYDDPYLADKRELIREAFDAHREMFRYAHERGMIVAPVIGGAISPPASYYKSHPDARCEGDQSEETHICINRPHERDRWINGIIDELFEMADPDVVILYWGESTCVQYLNIEDGYPLDRRCRKMDPTGANPHACGDTKIADKHAILFDVACRAVARHDPDVPVMYYHHQYCSYAANPAVLAELIDRQRDDLIWGIHTTANMFNWDVPDDYRYKAEWLDALVARSKRIWWLPEIAYACSFDIPLPRFELMETRLRDCRDLPAMGVEGMDTMQFWMHGFSGLLSRFVAESCWSLPDSWQGYVSDLARHVLGEDGARAVVDYMQLAADLEKGFCVSKPQTPPLWGGWPREEQMKGWLEGGRLTEAFLRDAVGAVRSYHERLRSSCGSSPFAREAFLETMQPFYWYFVPVMEFGIALAQRARGVDDEAIRARLRDAKEIHSHYVDFVEGAWRTRGEMEWGTRLGGRFGGYVRPLQTDMWDELVFQ